MSSPEEFRAYLRMVIKRAGLSYRQIADASGELPARSGGVEIKPATLSEILNKRLPTQAVDRLWDDGVGLLPRR